jgi:hypothetical protein
MRHLDRRSCLLAAAALAVSAAKSRAAQGSRMYDYLFLDLPFTPGKPAARAVAQALAPDRIAAAGGEALGVFAPQLGWSAGQAAVLLRWDSASEAREAAIGVLVRASGARSVRRDRLTPTLRPGVGDRPQPGGIYVHRWFVAPTDRLAEFVSISAEGWRDFEARFDAQIFGLLTAEQTDADRTAGVTRLLLLTRYGSHGVWEASRDPTTEAMTAFARRQQLTRDSWAASTLLVRPSA